MYIPNIFTKKSVINPPEQLFLPNCRGIITHFSYQSVLNCSYSNQIPYTNISN